MCDQNALPKHIVLSGKDNSSKKLCAPQTEMVPYAYEKVEVRNSVQRYISSNYVILSKFLTNNCNKISNIFFRFSVICYSHLVNRLKQTKSFNRLNISFIYIFIFIYLFIYLFISLFLYFFISLFLSLFIYSFISFCLIMYVIRC